MDKIERLIGEAKQCLNRKKYLFIVDPDFKKAGDLYVQIAELYAYENDWMQAGNNYHLAADLYNHPDNAERSQKKSAKCIELAGDSIINSDSMQGLEELKLAMNLYKSLDMQSQFVSVGNKIADFYKVLQMYKEAEQYYELTKSYNKITYMYRVCQDFEQAVKYYLYRIEVISQNPDNITEFIQSNIYAELVLTYICQGWMKGVPQADIICERYKDLQPDQYKWLKKVINAVIEGDETFTSPNPFNGLNLKGAILRSATFEQYKIIKNLVEEATNKAKEERHKREHEKAREKFEDYSDLFEKYAKFFEEYANKYGFKDRDREGDRRNKGRRRSYSDNGGSQYIKYCNILGVKGEASVTEIKIAYRKMALLYHPDKKGGDAEKMKEINNAYEYLLERQPL